MDEQNHSSLQELFEVTHQVPGRTEFIPAHKLGLGGLCLNSRELRTSSPNPRWLLQVKRATVSSPSADAGLVNASHSIYINGCVPSHQIGPACLLAVYLTVDEALEALKMELLSNRDKECSSVCTVCGNAVHYCLGSPFPHSLMGRPHLSPVYP